MKASLKEQLFPSLEAFLFFGSSKWKKSEEMERQRSFSFKPTRFLLFFFTISSSILFLSFLSIWFFQETPLQISPSFGLKPIKIQTLSRNLTVSEVINSNISYNGIRKAENFTGIKSEVENGVLRSTHYSQADNSSVKVEVLGGDERNEEKKQRNESTRVQNNKTRVQNNKTDEIIEHGILGSPNQRNSDKYSMEVKVSGVEKIGEKKRSECDVTNGKWVFDESYPLYTSSSCPFIDEGFSCEANGRLNTNYMKWRWQPHDCNIPRFNAVKMLELIRGKRLVFVGDSINRNQWESMLCLLRGAIADPKRVYETHGRRITKEKGNYSFKFLDYKCTVEYYVTHFLVHEGKARIGKKRVQTLRIDTLDRSSSRWKGADILVFNTAHWWSHFKTKSGVNYYQEGSQVYPHLDVPTAFRRALTTWASWIDKYTTPGKTQVFFRSPAPTHFRGGAWNAGGHCKEANQPFNDSSNTLYSEKNIIAEEVIKQMKTPVTLLNITSLSEFRIDAHPSVYGKRPGKGPPSRVEDCSHWCLPGVPDTWNELLYLYLQSNKNTSSTV